MILKYFHSQWPPLNKETHVYTKLGVKQTIHEKTEISKDVFTENVITMHKIIQKSYR